VLTGYQKPPANLPPELRPGQGLYYNPYFPNLNLAMPPPITADGQVTYADGTNPTRDQMAKDVTAFLVWTAEPNLQSRHRAGIAVLIFLLFATVLALPGVPEHLAFRPQQEGPDDRPAGSGEPGQERSRQARRGYRGLRLGNGRHPGLDPGSTFLPALAKEKMDAI
jgi:hypothetical protein